MLKASLPIYRSPPDQSTLSIADGGTSGDEILTGTLVSASGEKYPVRNGIPNFLYPPSLSQVEAATKAEYDRVADDIYDRAVDWQFAAFLEDEDRVREIMVDMLQVKDGMRVLEVGCGTGRDSFRLARRLGPAGELHMQDLSPRMVDVCAQRMKEYATVHNLTCKFEFSVSNATWLPYPDGYFDAVFHFGGFNHFGDLKRGAAELTRVTRAGGRVLYGDEAVAPWLKGTEFDGIVSTNNALFKADIPLTSVPECARDVMVRWLIANCFYVIAFNKGEGPPKLDLDLAHTGVRGGSLRSRFFGQLEGVDPNTKTRVREAAARKGVSIYDWLESTLNEAAARDMNK